MTKQLDTTMKSVIEKEDARDGVLSAVSADVKHISEAVHNRIAKDIRDLNWKDVLKLVLVKPWLWLCLALLSFSPKGVELIATLFDKASSFFK